MKKATIKFLPSFKNQRSFENHICYFYDRTGGMSGQKKLCEYRSIFKTMTYTS